MLYPRENTKELRRTGKKELIYSCRNCFAVQVIQVPKEAVYRNVVVHTAEYVLAPVGRAAPASCAAQTVLTIFAFLFHLLHFGFVTQREDEYHV